MNFETILFDKSDDGVATISLNRPERLNAFNQQMLDEMRTAWSIVRQDNEVRAVVVQAVAGRAFCTGVDVATEIGLFPGDPFRERSPAEAFGAKTNLVWKPVIAAVHGLCAGGGFYVINQADIIICSEDAQFFDPHVSFGLVAACEPVGLSRRIPYGEILRMSLMGNAERIGADTALRIHLVSEIVQNDKLAGRAREIAALIASRGSTATQGSVRVMWESLDLPYSAAIRNSYLYAQVGNPGTAADRAAVRSATKKEPYVVR
jgi:enoyl-CoA hydratase/carnithine racemase